LNQGQANSSQDPLLKNPSQKRHGGGAQGVGPELKAQYHTHTHKKEVCYFLNNFFLKKDTVFESGNGHQTPNIAYTITLDFLGSRTVRHKFLLFISYLGYVVLLCRLNDQESFLLHFEQNPTANLGQSIDVILDNSHCLISQSPCPSFD
jgi:hypothetical protein